MDSDYHNLWVLSNKINVLHSPPPKYIEVTVVNPLILINVLSSVTNVFLIKL